MEAAVPGLNRGPDRQREELGKPARKRKETIRTGGGAAVKARVIDKEGHLELLGDPASADLRPGDEVEIIPVEQDARPHKSVEGLWEGVDISEEDIAEVRREMFAPLDDGRG